MDGDIPQGYEPFSTSSTDPTTGEVRTLSGYAPRRTVQPPSGGGMSIPDMGPAFASAFKNLPVEEATKAIEAATQYIGQRGYLKDLQGGASAAQAFAKWGPMLFHRNATGIPEAIMRSVPTPLTDFQKAQIAHQTAMENKPVIHSTPGGGLYRVPVTGSAEQLIAPTPAAPKLNDAQREGLREAKQDLDRATKDATENINKKFTDPKVLDAASRAVDARRKIASIVGPVTPIATAQAASVPFKEGATIRNKKDGKLYKVVSGQPVEIKGP